MKAGINTREGRDSRVAYEISRKVLLGPIGVVLMVAMALVLGVLADHANGVGLVVWGVVCVVAFAAVVLIARAGS